MPPILALIPNWLGDVALCLPALAELRRDGQVAAVGHPALLALLADLQAVDATEAFDRQGNDAGLPGLLRAGRRLRAQHASLAVIFPPSLRAAALAAVARVPRRRGHPGDGRRWLLTELRPRPPRSVHLADAWLSLARADGLVRAGEALPHASPGPAGRAGLRALRAALPALPSAGSFLALSPGATYGPTKRWGEARYAAAARELCGRHGLTAVVVGGPDAQERALCARVAEGCGGISVAGRTDLPTLAALLAEAAAFLGNDSGPMHLAAALSVPTVGVFGSTSPAWTAPRGRAASSCGPHPVPCAPCFRSRCPIGLPCLEQLPASSAVEAVEALLAAHARPAGAGGGSFA
jgi:heptosyltransferase-2